jgi:hypothetical protein
MGIDLVQSSLERGANVHAVTVGGNTPPHRVFSVSIGSTITVVQLDHGANTEARKTNEEASLFTTLKSFHESNRHDPSPLNRLLW